MRPIRLPRNPHLTCFWVEPCWWQSDRLRLLAAWEEKAEKLEAERSDCLKSLPSHAKALYEESGFHGPLFREMFQFLVSLGYSDTSLWRDICSGFPSSCVLPRTGLWPIHPKAAELRAARKSSRAAFEAAPVRLRAWAQKRRADENVVALLERNRAKCTKRRRVELSPDALQDGCFVAHPEFMLQAGQSLRACNDCTVSGWIGLLHPFTGNGSRC